MKTIALIIFHTAIIGSMSAVLAQTTEYTANRVGVGTNNTLIIETLFGSPTPGSGMLAVGQNNQVGANNSAAIGAYNTLRQNYALAVGYSNTLGELGNNTSSSVAIGQQNYLAGDFSLVVGMSNSMYKDSEWGGATSSMIVGGWNYNQGEYSMIVGKNNSIPSVSGDETVHNPAHTTVLGSGLISRYDNCTVIGKNNLSPIPTVPPTGRAPLLVVGNGTSTSARANALEVFDNGDIIITKPQGDISMGIYGE